MRALTASLILLFSAGILHAASLEMQPPRPNVILKAEPTSILFTTRLISEPGRNPTQVRLLRLQANGNLIEVSPMWDDGSHGDAAAQDRIYTCNPTLKESDEGMISFTAEALYSDTLLPVRSRAAFLRIFGGITLKEKKAMYKTIQRAGKLYAKLNKEQGLIPAQRETIAWLMKQEGVVSVNLISKRDLYIQFLSGAGMILNGPPESESAKGK